MIIDEACQAVELSSLIAMQYKCRRLILIGDPIQLPATIFSKQCELNNYDQSLFERLMKCGVPVHMLKVHFSYLEFPSLDSILPKYPISPAGLRVTAYHAAGERIAI